MKPRTHSTELFYEYFGGCLLVGRLPFLYEEIMRIVVDGEIPASVFFEEIDDFFEGLFADEFIHEFLFIVLLLVGVEFGRYFLRKL